MVSHNKHNTEQGQSLVEFAISITFILLLLAGTVDLGSAFFAFIELRDAAQEGAFYGAIHAIVDSNNNGVYDSGEALNTSEIILRASNAATTPVDLTDTTKVTFNVTADPPCAGNTITVEVTYNYQLITPILGGVIGSQTIPIHAKAANTILWPSCP